MKISWNTIDRKHQTTHERLIGGHKTASLKMGTSERAAGPGST